MRKIITPANNQHHNDHVVGKHWVGQCIHTNEKVVYFCDQYQSGIGYRMTNTTNPSDRKHVLEHEVLRSFCEA